MGSVKLARVGGLATALVVTVSIAGATAVISAITAALALDEAEAFINGEISEDAFIDAYSPSALVGTAQSVSFLATVVLTFVWMQRIAANHRTLQRVGTWGPGWAIGGWFLPPLVLYVVPFLMLRELWRASDPSVPVGSDAWKQSRVSPIVPTWWALYGLVPLGLAVVQGVQAVQAGLTATSARDLAELLDDSYTITLLGGLVTLAGAIAWVLLVRGLTDRHRRLTGEATTFA
jgi:hypothetical protein